MTRTFPAAALVMAFGTAALAQDLVIDPAVDVNSDGMYSFVELTNLYPEFEVETFGAVDMNGDGLLDEVEVAAADAAGLMPIPTE